MGKDSWLWHGFSTRRGGVSRAYRAEDAPGELNLGFTADDDREAVTREPPASGRGVSGDAATPLVAARQIHSNVVTLHGADARRERPARGRRPDDR